MGRAAVGGSEGLGVRRPGLRPTLSSALLALTGALGWPWPRFGRYHRDLRCERTWNPSAALGLLAAAKTPALGRPPALCTACVRSEGAGRAPSVVFPACECTCERGVDGARDWGPCAHSRGETR